MSNRTYSSSDNCRVGTGDTVNVRIFPSTGLNQPLETIERDTFDEHGATKMFWRRCRPVESFKRSKSSMPSTLIFAVFDASSTSPAGSSLSCEFEAFRSRKFSFQSGQFQS